MAREEEDIFQAIVDDKDADANLAELNSSSNTAIWRLWAFITASAIYTLEKLMDVFKEEITVLADSFIVGTLGWYKNLALAFTYADVAIVARVAVVESDSLVFKVCKESAGDLVALDSSEQLAFKGYMNKNAFAGTHITVLSLNADKLRTTGTYFYDATKVLQDVKDDVDAKVDAYLKGLDYNAFLTAKKFDDILQGCLGYYDHQLDTLESTPAAAVSWAAVGRRVQPLAGYIRMDTPISSMLTFTPTPKTNE